MWHGDIALGNTIDIKFTTRQSTGAPTTLAGSPVISAYVGNGTTEITAGITLTVDFDSRTGLNNVRVVATSGNGFATATDVELVITTGTVNAVSVVGEVIGSFSIENRSALRPATVNRTLVVDAAGLADANVVKLGPTGSGTAQTARDIGASVLVGDKTGFSLSGTQTFNNTGTWTGNIVGTLSTVTTLTNLPAITANWLTAAGIAAGALNGKGDWLLSSSYTAPLTAATTRSALGMASANLDVQLAALDADILTRLATSSYTAPPTAAQNAVALLQYDMSTISAEANFSVQNALRKLRNRWGISGTDLLIYGEDGVTVKYQQVLTALAGANPIVAIANP